VDLSHELVVEPNPTTHLLQRVEIYRKAREESHLVGTGVRGHDLPAVGKLWRFIVVFPATYWLELGKAIVHQVRASARSGLTSLT
jgi:hypothetical protein